MPGLAAFCAQCLCKYSTVAMGLWKVVDISAGAEGAQRPSPEHARPAAPANSWPLSSPARGASFAPLRRAFRVSSALPRLSAVRACCFLCLSVSLSPALSLTRVFI